MLVTIENIGETELYPEIINKIARGDENSTTLHILAAESLVKSYMRKYDIDAIFGTETEAPTHNDEHIKKLVKAIASWYIVKKANPNINLDLFRIEYEDAKEWLNDLKKGLIDPNLPYRPEVENTDTGTGVFMDSNIKRTNHF